MTLHFPDQTPTNLLTIDATDPKSGTAEFKASAVAIEPVGARPPRTTAEAASTAGRSVAGRTGSCRAPPTVLSHGRGASVGLD